MMELRYISRAVVRCFTAARIPMLQPNRIQAVAAANIRRGLSNQLRQRSVQLSSSWLAAMRCQTSRWKLESSAVVTFHCASISSSGSVGFIRKKGLLLVTVCQLTSDLWLDPQRRRGALAYGTHPAVYLTETTLPPESRPMVSGERPVLLEGRWTNLVSVVMSPRERLTPLLAQEARSVAQTTEARRRIMVG